MKSFVLPVLICCFLLQALSGLVGAHPWHFSEQNDSDATDHWHVSLQGSVENAADHIVEQESTELCLDCQCHSGQATLPLLANTKVRDYLFERCRYRLWYYPKLQFPSLRPPIYFF